MCLSHDFNSFLFLSHKSPDEIVTEVCEQIQGVLPEILDKDEAGETTFLINDEGIMDSLATVLSHEMVKFNKLLVRCASSLMNMKKAIKG